MPLLKYFNQTIIALGGLIVWSLLRHAVYRSDAILWINFQAPVGLRGVNAYSFVLSALEVYRQTRYISPALFQ